MTAACVGPDDVGETACAEDQAELQARHAEGRVGRGDALPAGGHEIDAGAEVAPVRECQREAGRCSHGLQEQERPSMRTKRSSRSPSLCVAKSAKSKPALKFLPSPRKTSSAASLRCASSTPAISASTSSADSALRFSGRESVKVQAAPSRAMVRAELMSMRLSRAGHGAAARAPRRCARRAPAGAGARAGPRPTSGSAP